MKKFTKIISVVLIVVAMLMVTFMPAFALFESGNAYIWLEKEQTNSDPDIYKITMHLEADYTVPVGDFRVYWPSNEWKLIRNTGAAGTSATARNAVNYLGSFADEEEYDSDGPDGYVVGPGAANKSVVVNVNDQYFSETVPKDSYGAIQIVWLTANESHYYYDSSRWGNEVAEFYVQKLDGAPDDAIDHVAIREDVMAYEFNYRTMATGDSIAKESKPAQQVSPFAQPYTVHYNVNPNAAAGPKVEREKGQIKMTVTGDRTVADEFQFRVLSKISDADWKAYLANTGSSEDNNCLTKLGFVAYKGTEDFDMAQAQAAAKAGETQGNYYVATTNYVKHADGSDAEFAARIDTSKDTCEDATYIAFIQYKDADGMEQYAFYDAEYTALIKTSYDSLVSQYLAQFPSAS